MPFSTEFTSDGLGILQSGHGTVTGEDLIAETVRVSQSRSQLSRVRYALIDLSGITEFDVTLADLSQVASADIQVVASIARHMAVAVIATGPVGSRLARMWEMLAAGTGWRITVVDTRDAAVAWLRTQVPDVAF